MSTIGRDSQEPLVSMATVSEWRRRQRADAAASPPPEAGEEGPNGFNVPEGGSHANGFQLPESAGHANGSDANGQTALNGSTDSIGRNFAESQRVGLTALFGFARLEPHPQPLPSAKPGVPEPERPASLHGDAIGDTFTQPLAVIDQHQVVDQPGLSARPNTPNLDRAPATEPREGGASRVFSYIYVPALSLFVILTVQVVLSLKLLWSNTAFSDEALYLWAGHLELAHWLHGTPIPAFPTYFSGSPVIYPPLGALADSLGGLAGARLLSLCFILGATTLLWATASRLFGYRAGFFAAGLWAFLGPTLHLSAFATFDAMSLFLMALSVWCIVRAGPRRDAAMWMLAAACALALSNATAYSSAIVDPIIFLFALLVNWPEPTRKLAVMRATSLGAYTVAVLVLLVTAGGGLYVAGIAQTVIDRVSGKDAAAAVLHQGLIWVAPVAILAAIGLLISAAFENQTRLWPLAALVSAALLITLEQARLQTNTSLDKHVDFGAWLGAIVAGYAVAKVLSWLSRSSLRVLATIACACALVVPVRLGLAQGRATFASWPNAADFVTVLRPLADRSAGPMLVEDSPIAEYYLSCRP